MEPTINTNLGATEDISLRDIIVKVQECFKYLLKKWVAILLFGVLGAGLGLTYSLIKKTLYVAELTFVLEESKSSSLGSYAGIASQFGIDLGGSGSGVFSGDNILEFFKSRLMIEKTLLSPVQLSGKSESLADYYISVYKLREQWRKIPELKNISLPYNLPRRKFSLQQDSILQVIYQTIEKEYLIVTKPNKKLSFIAVKCKSRSELFAKLFVERLVTEAIDFYVVTKTQRSKANVDKLEAKADSIYALLNRKTFQVAATQDVNFNPVKNIARVSSEVESRDKAMLQIIYSEVIKNLEMSKMSMAQETPIIQIIDTPILPLKKEKLGKLKGLLLGGMVGGFIVITWFFTRRIYKEIMS